MICETDMLPQIEGVTVIPGLFTCVAGTKKVKKDKYNQVTNDHSQANVNLVKNEIKLTSCPVNRNMRKLYEL